MAELKCGAKECTYNKDCLCAKGDIMVGGKHADKSADTCCESFLVKRENDSYTSSISHPSKMISIDCEAVKCIYNQNYKCVASHVDIRGDRASKSEETICATFKEK